MKARIVITTEKGTTYEAEVDLVETSGSVTSEPGHKVPKRGKHESYLGSPSVAMPLRPYLRQYAQGKSGAAKMTLLIAHLAGGKAGVPVDSAAVQAAWNRTTAFLGEFNRAHGTRAKDNGWIDSPAHGQYVLTDTWTEAAK